MFNEQQFSDTEAKKKQNFEDHNLLGVPLEDREDPMSDPGSGYNRTESDNTGYFRHLSTLNAGASHVNT